MSVDVVVVVVIDCCRDVLADRVSVKKGRTLAGAVTCDMRVAYVQQEDALVGVLTVAETLLVAALLAGVPRSRCDELVRELGLESARDTKVGTIFQKGLSGGQKRRLSIAVELVSRPRVLLADEPTSGLDSASALAVMEQLRKIATASGECKECAAVAICATLHQPSNAVWALIDDVCFLAKGRLVYFGTADDALLDFLVAAGHGVPRYSNIPDFVLTLINEDFPGHADVPKLVAKFQADHPAPPAAPPRRAHKRLHGASWLVRFATLCWRAALETRRDVGIIGVRLAMYSMLSVLIMLMFFDLGSDKKDQDVSARVSILFYVAAFMVFMSVAVLPFFVLQRPIFVKERCNGAYGVSEYVLAKLVTSTLPGTFLLALVSSVIVVFPVGLNGWPIYFLDLFVSLVVAESFMSLVAVCVPHFIVGIALAAGLFGFNMLCEGFFRVKHSIPTYLIWAHYQAFHTYSFRVFMWNEFNPVNRFDGPQFLDGEDVLQFYDMGKVNVRNDILVLVAWAVFFQLAFALVLYFFHKGQR